MALFCLLAGEKTAFADPEPEAPPPPPTEIVVLGRRPPPPTGASDYRIDPGELARVPRDNASSLLELAPSFFLSNEGGEGHPERIYLRGFDARAGQDIELSVGGVPINESGNLHGNGFADLHFILPELVSRIRVLEGPFDPRQGNYAVAGSADYELGLARRGLSARLSTGSFDTHRLLFLWGPPGSSNHTFAGAELYSTSGFGQNRDARRATAMSQYEGALGETGSYHLGASAYATEYHSAGLLREDDVAAGKIGFYDTYDRRQGGGGSRFSVWADMEKRAGEMLYYQQFFVVQRSMRLRENFTGFLLDTQKGTQSPHGQRGDLLDLGMRESTFGARGYARLRGRLGKRKQELELGYFARGDLASALRQRIESASGAPYLTDADLESTLFDIGLYADTTLRPLPYLTLRGGLRGDLFTFDVLDKCAVKDVSRPNRESPPGDASCLDQQRFGRYREPRERSSTASVKLMPRATLLLGPFAHFSLSLSYGAGVRSIDPIYITQDVATPFASIEAFEGGVSYLRSTGDTRIEARSIVFGTHVDRDLIFSETEGRNVLGGGTTRAGWLGSLRAGTSWLDESMSVTLVKSTFDDTGLLVPYVPDVVVRSDTAVFHDLPVRLFGSPLRASLGAGISYIGRRALPYGQRSDTIFKVDTEAALGFRGYELSVSVQNLFDAQYRLAEFNFASDFHSQAAPTLVPARHFVAGAPRRVMVGFQATFGGP